MSTLSELFKRFELAQTHAEQIELYEAIKAEQIKQEQAALAVIYGKDK